MMYGQPVRCGAEGMSNQIQSPTARQQSSWAAYITFPNRNPMLSGFSSVAHLQVQGLIKHSEKWTFKEL